MVTSSGIKQNQSINLESFGVGEKKVVRQFVNDHKSEEKSFVHDE